MLGCPILRGRISVGVQGPPKRPARSGLGQTRSQDDPDEAESRLATMDQGSVSNNLSPKPWFLLHLWYRRQEGGVVRTQAAWVFYLLPGALGNVLHLFEPQCPCPDSGGDSRACPRCHCDLIDPERSAQSLAHRKC